MAYLRSMNCTSGRGATTLRGLSPTGTTTYPAQPNRLPGDACLRSSLRFSLFRGPNTLPMHRERAAGVHGSETGKASPGTAQGRRRPHQFTTHQARKEDEDKRKSRQVIERDIPRIGNATAEEVRTISRKSCSVPNPQHISDSRTSGESGRFRFSGKRIHLEVRGFTFFLRRHHGVSRQREELPR